MLIVAPQTIKNAGVLETRSLPKKFFGRVQLVPKGAGIGLWARLILEIQFLRYMAALVPFIAIPSCRTTSRCRSRRRRWPWCW
jgi:hypothetical protein